MGKAALVEPDIDAGRQLIDVLRQHGFPVEVAAWVHDEENEDWELVVATAKVDNEGPRAAYTRLQEYLLSGQLSGRLALSDVRLVGTTSPVVTSLREASLNVPPGSDGLRLTHNVLGGLLIDDVYVYRLN